MEYEVEITIRASIVADCLKSAFEVATEIAVEAAEAEISCVYETEVKEVTQCG